MMIRQLALDDYLSKQFEPGSFATLRSLPLRTPESTTSTRHSRMLAHRLVRARPYGGRETEFRFRQPTTFVTFRFRPPRQLALERLCSPP